ncbi:MAG TPA: NAD-dependent epimerase/dehydratase family protein, partial [Phycisphaerales bacterium]|nr:NAD-dependent epimerase/dehydratase family protein [Phycisphaerales bacterium]
MHLTRRSFLASTLVAAAGAQSALAALGQPPAPEKPKADPKPAVRKADKPLKVLFLGGTVFLGPATVDRLLARGHTVTLFNRGKSNPKLYPDLEKLTGNRAGDLKSLEAEVAKGRKWDVVIDTSAYVPKQMRASATALKDAVDHYIMIASVNVYKSEAEPNQDENAPTHEEWPDDAKVSNENYGAMKRGCEVALSEVMPNRWASVRPALIVGPRDPSDRFSYWPLRARRGGDI